MRGSRWLAVLVAFAIGVTGITTGTAAGTPAGKDPGKKHRKHKQGKHGKQGKKHKQGKKGKKRKRGKPKPKRPRPVGSPMPAPDGVSVTVDALIGSAFNARFSASRAAGAPATAAQGSFQGFLRPGGGMALSNVEGPVTCLSVVGNDIGIFYPIEQSSPPGLESLGGVFISVTTDGQGNAQMGGFMPTPAKTADSCDPAEIPPILSATGSATIAQG